MYIKCMKTNPVQLALIVSHKVWHRGVYLSPSVLLMSERMEIVQMEITRRYLTESNTNLVRQKQTKCGMGVDIEKCHGSKGLTCKRKKRCITKLLNLFSSKYSSKYHHKASSFRKRGVNDKWRVLDFLH